MAGQRHPRPICVSNPEWKSIDSGTLNRGCTPPPSTVSTHRRRSAHHTNVSRHIPPTAVDPKSPLVQNAVRHFRDSEQGITMVDLDSPDGKLATVYFATDESTLDPQDKAQLINLFGRFAKLLFGPQKHRYSLNLKFIGYADYRGTEQHNLGLSQRRAECVAAYFDQLNRSTRYSRGIVAMGESETPQNATTSKGLNPFRRVDVFAKITPPLVTPPITTISNDTVSKCWMIRLIQGYSFTPDPAEILKALGKKFASEPLKVLAKVLPVSFGVTVISVEIVDLLNRVGMLYIFKGFSAAAGWDLNFSPDASDWLFASTSESIRIEHFEGGARHYSVGMQPGWGFTWDWMTFLGPMQHRADSVFIGPWRGRGAGAINVTAGGEIKGTLERTTRPYALPADYLNGWQYLPGEESTAH